MKPFRFVAAVFFAFLLALPLAAQAQSRESTPAAILEVPPEPSVWVTGTADLSRPPDQAELVFGVTARSPSAAEAQSQVNEALTRTLDALRQLGITTRDIRTTEISVQPVYDTSGDGEGMRIEAYQALNSVEVKVPPERVGPVLDVALREDTNRIEWLSYGIENDVAAQRAVLREAFGQARAKAEALAAAGGFELEGVVEVVETVEPVQIDEWDWTALDALEMGRTPITPGNVALTGSVSVRFAIAKDGDERVQTRGETDEQ
jgi:hypothetical protein